MPHHYSSQPAGVPSSYHETWERLTPTLRGVLHGRPAQFIAYCHLWYLCDGRPQTISITGSDLGSKLGGKDQRTSRGWLDGLRQIGLIEFDDRDRDTGQYTLYIHGPDTQGKPRVTRGDPQPELFDSSVGGGVSPAALGIIAGVFAQEPPRPELGAGASAQEPPRPRPSAEVSAQKAPRSGQLSLWGSEKPVLTKTPAGASAQEPTMGHGTIEHVAIGSAPSSEKDNSLPVTPAGTKTAPLESKFCGPSVLVGMAERDAKEKVDHEALMQLQQQCGRPVSRIAVDDAAEAFAVKKARIVERLIEWTDEFEPHTNTRMDAKRAGQIADHVLVDALALGLTESELCDWMTEIRRWFFDGRTINGKLIQNPAGLLDARLEKLLAECGVPSRAKSKRRAK